ncbi:hypothetical protein [Halobacillus ihumii]|uniref:hypothetical protein n=1 Tax=Halobacillus ihumii TaxID=2686092 RepID=UPI0013D7BE00|nr:hypothetical protein [Halobacillus ihumii]
MKVLQLVTIGILVILLFVVVQINQDLRDERKQTKEEINALKEELNSTKETLASQTSLMTSPQQKAISVAENFVHSYFGYNKQPEKEEVDKYVTETLMQNLTFQESERKYPGGVNSNISDLTVYYGKHTSTTQTLFFTFNNRFIVSDVTSSISSYLRVDMIKEHNKWKVDDISLNQF